MSYIRTDDQPKPSIETVLQRLHKQYEETNIADLLDDDELKKIGAEVKSDYELDEDSRKEWKETADKAMDVALQVRQPKNYPFEGASNIKYPLVTVAALQFGARAYPAIVDGQRIVKGVPLGEDKDGKKRETAERVSQHMSYQLLYEMEEWEEDTDILLHHLPIVGCAFRKVWRDGRLNRNKAQMVPATRLVVNQKVQSLDDAQRVTDEVPLFPQDIEERKRAGEFRDIDLPNADNNDLDAPHEFLEQHRYLDLDGDGYREPYIVTIHKESNEVARIVANYKPDEIEHDGKRIIRIPKRQYFVKYSFLRDPKGGFYDIGFGQLLESLSDVIDTTINQMMDAGHLQNAGGGFIGSGLRLKKGTIRLQPGRYQYVEAPGTVIKDAIYNMEHPGPSPVLFQLLELLLSATKDITGVKDILTGDSGNKGVQTATTTLAMIDQGLKVFTSIYKRVWTALRQEMKLLAKLNAEYLTDEEYFTFLDSEGQVSREDYNLEAIDVVPVADPRMVTDMQKAARAQFLQEMLAHPLINQEEALHRIFDAAGETNIDTLLVEQNGDAAQAEQAAMQQQTEAAFAIEQMKAQTTAETDRAKAQADGDLAKERTAIELDMQKDRQDNEAEIKRAELALKEREVALKEDAAVLDAELKRRETDANIDIQQADQKSREKAAPDQPDKETSETKGEPVTVNLNITESSSKKIKLERGKNDKISGAVVE